MANSSYPLLDEDALTLAQHFLDLKREHGNPVEKALYKDLDLLGLVQRLIAKVRLI